VVSDEKRVDETWRTTLDRVDIQVPQDGQRIDLVDIDLKAGMSGPELTQKLSQILPQAVDRITPDGTIPNA
jgi:uncharacterized protein YidB (DUF937 family)